MVVEISVFFILLCFTFAITAAHRAWVRHRDRCRGRWVAGTLNRLAGRSIGEAFALFGPPFETNQGTGRVFYVWKSPPSDRFPKGTGLLIVNLLTDQQGQIEETSWQTR